MRNLHKTIRLRMNSSKMLDMKLRKDVKNLEKY